MRPRVPLAYAGLLIIALVAVAGFAAFSPSSGTDTDVGSPSTVVQAEPEATMSARVASAVLALRVSDAASRTATTQGQEAPQNATDATDDAVAELDVESGQTTTSTQAAQQEAASTTAAPAPEAKDTTPPSFSVTSPSDGATVDSSIVTFKGTVEQGATVASGPYEATVNDDGTWSIDLAVVDGANGAAFTATDSAGNTASARIVVNYEAPQTTTTKAPATNTTSAPSTPTTTSATTTTSGSSSSKWSPNWPADSGGQRDVESWRPLVAQYWASDRVDCVLGIIKRESGGDPTAYNSSFGASGLMQHLIKYWDSRAAGAGFKDSNGLVASPFNAEANIAAGAYIAGSGSNWYTPWSYLPDYGSCLDS